MGGDAGVGFCGSLDRMWTTFKVMSVWVVCGAFAGIVGIPITLLIGDINWLYRWAMSITRTGLRVGGITADVAGLEHIPAGRACIIVSNHVSNLDPPIEITRIPTRCSVLLKKQITDIPILGRAMKMALFVPVARGHSREAAKAGVAAAAKALAAGLHIIVYPEGTRSPDGRLQAFKKGPFFLAMETGAPVLPIAIWGTERMMRKGSSAMTPGEATMRVLPVIEPGDFASREALMVAVKAAIAAALPERMRPLEA